MNSSDEIVLEVEGAVAVVTLNAPARRNALTPAMAKALIAVLEEVDSRAGVGALVVRGVGKSFCAGGDVATLISAGKDPAEPANYQDISAIYDAFHRLGKVKVPTVAAVRGSAVGAGMNLLLAADLRVVANDARLLCGFLRRGLHPGGGHFVLLTRLIGREAAAAMSLFGEEISGARARDIGLAWDAVDDAAVEQRAFELAARAADDAPLARMAIENFRREVDQPGLSWDVAMQVERPAQMWSMRRV